MSGFRVRRWTSEEFSESGESWQRLLARSTADPLFMSWDWIRSWWRHHETMLHADLCVLGVYSENGELCGIAPLYGHRAVHRTFLAARRLELLGNTWRDAGAIFSEYLDIIADRERAAAVCEAVHGWLRASSEWDELLLCNVRSGSLAAQLGAALSDLAYVRAVESMNGWSIALPASFADFSARLSSNTRRKLVHQREKLKRATFELTPPAESLAVLGRLDAFVARRFRAPPAQDSVRSRFHADLVERGAHDGSVRLSELRVDGNCISVMLNLRVGGTEYYLQSGFDVHYASGISPGYLHLGYAIEAACRDRIERFDFLAGRGLNRDYKQDFAAVNTPLHSLQVVRKPLLRALFGVFDRLGGRTSHTAPPGD